MVPLIPNALSWRICALHIRVGEIDPWRQWRTNRRTDGRKKMSLFETHFYRFLIQTKKTEKYRFCCTFVRSEEKNEWAVDKWRHFIASLQTFLQRTRDDEIILDHDDCLCGLQWHLEPIIANCLYIHFPILAGKRKYCLKRTKWSLICNGQA